MRPNMWSQKVFKDLVAQLFHNLNLYLKTNKQKASPHYGHQDNV